jgi:hypothetical protein
LSMSCWRNAASVTARPMICWTASCDIGVTPVAG